MTHRRMKKKRQTVRSQKPSPGKTQGRTPASPGAEKPSVPATATHAAPVPAIKYSGLGLPKFPRPDTTPSAKQGCSASEILALSHFFHVRRQRKPATKDALKLSFIKSLSSLRERCDSPASDSSNPLRRLLKECATHPLEEYFASWFPLKWLSAFSISMANPLVMNQLSFRCWLVPKLCGAWLQAATKNPQKMSLFLNQYSSRARAFERLCCELEAHTGQMVSGKSTALSAGPPDWLNCNADEARQRLDKFDAWRKAALNSFFHFHRQFYSDIGFSDPKESLAAWVGFAVSKTPLPAQLIDFLVQTEQLFKSSRLRVLTRDYTKSQTSRWGSAYQRWKKEFQKEKPPTLLIDCWLIEVWPLVLAQKWGHPSLFKLAESKFKEFQSTPSERKLQERCSTLGLTLADCRRRGGAEPKSTRVKTPLSPAARLAAAIRGIAECPEEWMHGGMP